MKTKTTIVESTLSDGSKVYNLVIEQGENTVIFHCISENDAVEVEERLYKSTVNFLMAIPA